MNGPSIDGIKELDPEEGAEKDCTASQEPSIIASDKDLASVGSENPNPPREPIHHLQTGSASIDADCETVLNGLKQAFIQAETGYAHQIVTQQQAAVRMMKEQEAALRSQISRSAEMIPFPRIRVRLPDVVLTPDGREDFTYINGRLVTSGVCSLSDVGDIPFPRVVRLFEYWKKHPPTHETLAKISEQLSTILGTTDSSPMPDGPPTVPPAATHQPRRESDSGAKAGGQTVESTANLESSREMKPDWNLMRLVILAAENSKNPGLRPMDGYSQAEVGYQAHLLIEAGLGQGSSVQNTGHNGPSAYIRSVTLPGHEFAELARDENEWNLALAEAERRGVVTLDDLRQLLKDRRRRNAALNLFRPIPPPFLVMARETLTFAMDDQSQQPLTLYPTGAPQSVPGWVRDTNTFKVAQQARILSEVRTRNASVDQNRQNLTSAGSILRKEEVRNVAPSPKADSSNAPNLYAKRVHFQYRYPEDFPVKAQRQMESLRVKANASLRDKPIDSFADWSEVKRVWVLELASGAATIIGRIAAMTWSANQSRETLKDFTLQAARAVGMTAPAAERFFKSDEWKTLDDALFPPEAEDEHAQQTGEETPSTLPKSAAHSSTEVRPSTRVSALGPVTDQPTTEGARSGEESAPAGPKKPGRPAQIGIARKEAAIAARERGESWKEAAKILYDNKYPTGQQVKNAPNVLKNYKRSRVPHPNNS